MGLGDVEKLILRDASVTSVIENKIDKKVQKSLKMAKEMSII